MNITKHLQRIWSVLGLAIGFAAMVCGNLQAQGLNDPALAPNGSVVTPDSTSNAAKASLPAKIAHVVDSHFVYRVDVANKKMVGTRVPINRTLTDIAFSPNGNLYAIDFLKFYVVQFNSQRKIYEAIQRGSSLGQNGALMNALVCPSNTYCLSFGDKSQKLFKIDIATGRATPITPANKLTGFTSDGDLTFHEGSLFLSANGKKLIRLNPTNGVYVPGSEKADNITDLWGLVSTGTNKLYGFGLNSQNKPTLYEINEDTGAKESTTVLPATPNGPDQIRGAAYKP